MNMTRELWSEVEIALCNKFTVLCLQMMAHFNTYGQPPDYKKTAVFLARGGWVGAVRRGESV